MVNDLVGAPRRPAGSADENPSMPTTFRKRGRDASRPRTRIRRKLAEALGIVDGTELAIV